MLIEGVGVGDMSPFILQTSEDCSTAARQNVLTDKADAASSQPLL